MSGEFACICGHAESEHDDKCSRCMCSCYMPDHPDVDKDEPEKPEPQGYVFD